MKKMKCYICGKKIDFSDLDEARYDVKEEQFCHRSCFRIMFEGKLMLRAIEGEQIDELFIQQDIDEEEASTLVEPKFH